MDSVLSKWRSSTLQLILFVVGAGLLYLGEEWHIPIATPIGMACIALFLVVAGIDMCLQRLYVFRIDGWTRAKVVDTYRGLGELLWGLLFVFAGLVLTAIVLVNGLWPGLSDTFWGNLLSTPGGLGTILGIIGLMMLLSGLVRALAGSGSVDPQKLGGLPYIFDRLAGGGTFLLGAAISGVGLLLLVAPGVVTGAIEGLKHLVVGP
jgi:hypothetical protein